MGLAGKLVIEIQDDGTIKTNARELKGSEAQILAELAELAKAVGGTLTLEKHEPGIHHHHHDHEKGGHHHNH